MGDAIGHIILSWLIFIVISYIVFITILLIFNPEFYNSDGSINWLTPLWIVALLSLFIVLFIVIIVGC